MRIFINSIQGPSKDLEERLRFHLSRLERNKTDRSIDHWILGECVMQLLKISKTTLRSLRENGILTYSRIDGKSYYNIVDVMTSLEKQESGLQKERRNHGTN